MAGLSDRIGCVIIILIDIVYVLNRKLEKYCFFAEGDFYKFFFGNSILPVFL